MCDKIKLTKAQETLILDVVRDGISTEFYVSRSSARITRTLAEKSVVKRIPRRYGNGYDCALNYETIQFSFKRAGFMTLGVEAFRKCEQSNLKGEGR